MRTKEETKWAWPRAEKDYCTKYNKYVFIKIPNIQRKSPLVSWFMISCDFFSKWQKQTCSLGEVQLFLMLRWLEISLDVFHGDASLWCIAQCPQ